MNFNYDVLDDTEKIIFALRSLYESYGYARYKMGKFEEYDLYSRNKDFLVSDSVITFTDTNGKLMALKPDVTLSIIKNNKDTPGILNKLCYNENVYRVSKGSNSFREIMQTGLECIGCVDEKCIGEVLFLAARSLETLSSDFVLEVSHLGILSALVDLISPDIAIKQAILKCAGEKNVHEIKTICKNNDIPQENANSLCELIGIYGSLDKVLPKLFSVFKNNNIMDKIEELKNIFDIFHGSSLEKNIQIDFSVSADINYYNGIIFKGFISGIPGSVLSGGQYDKLMKKMGRKSKAVGFAVYLDMLDRLSDTKQ